MEVGVKNAAAQFSNLLLNERGEVLDDETFARALGGALRRCEEALTARRSYGDVMEDEFARMRRYAEQNSLWTRLGAHRRAEG